MRFSLVGDLDEASLFVDGVVGSPECSLGAVWIHGGLEQKLSHRFPANAVRVGSPEDALIALETDAVIVAESDPEKSIRASRHASQADRHVVVIPARGISTAYSYELHLLLDESRCGILILSGCRYLPPSLDVSPSAADDFELSLPPPEDDGRDRAAIMYAVDQIAALGFATSQVTALEVGRSGMIPISRQIVLAASPHDVPGQPGITLNSSASAEPVRLHCRSSPEAPSHLITVPSHVEQMSEAATKALCADVVQSLDDSAVCETAMLQFSRTLQITEAIDRSLRRRRTIDVYHEGVTERSVFKTQMTAIGCGVLTWLLLGLVAYLVTAKLLNPPRIVLQVLRILWILPAVLFLLAQLLLPFARGRRTGEIAPPDDV